MINQKLASKLRITLSKIPHIKLIYIFGSTVHGRIKSDSDFDLAIIVDDASKITYKEIYKLLFPIKFPADLDLSIVDKKASPLFLFQIISTGKCVYQKSADAKVLFEANVMKNYYDTQHLRKIYYLYLKTKFPYARQ